MAMLRAGRCWALAAFCLAAGAAQAGDVIEVGRLEIPSWKARHEAKLLEARSRPIDLVLLGDSITHQYEYAGPPPDLDYREVWRRHYAGRRALNLGFSGDGTAHALWRITHGEIDGLAPKAVVILIGANDIGWLLESAEQAVRGIDAVVAETHRRLPAAKILLVGLLPSDRGSQVTQATNAINAALAARHGKGETAGVVFQDVSAAFLKRGAIDASLFRDPRQDPPEPALHPSPEGQERMAAALEPMIAQLLGDQPRLSAGGSVAAAIPSASAPDPRSDAPASTPGIPPAAR